MDEPFGALDAQTRPIMQEELLKLWSQFNTTGVFVTHNIDEAGGAKGAWVGPPTGGFANMSTPWARRPAFPTSRLWRLRYLQGQCHGGGRGDIGRRDGARTPPRNSLDGVGASPVCQRALSYLYFIDAQHLSAT